MNPCELTGRQRDVIDLVCQGLMNKEIAARLNLSPRTVELHRALAMRAIGARTVPDAVRIWDRLRHAEPKLIDRRRRVTPRDAAAHSPARVDATVPADLQAPAFVTAGKQVLRDGEHFVDAATPEIARAIALAFGSAQLLFSPDVPAVDQDFVANTLWPLCAQPLGETLDELVGADWEA